MENKKSIELTYRYWNSPNNLGLLAGVYPMGRGGLLEVYYRHYWEVQHFRQEVPLNNTMRMLELGCGNGRWISALAPLVKHYTAVDFSHHAINVAREYVRSLNLSNVELQEKSVLDFESAVQFDIIYFSGVLQYLQDEEIKVMLRNINPCIKNDTILVDRSTINYSEREVANSNNYFSIYRKPEELQRIFSNNGFQLIYRKRTYPFLRGGSIFERMPFKKTLPILAQLTSPISFQFLRKITLCANFINPIPFEGGNRSHDFFIFKQDGVS